MQVLLEATWRPVAPGTFPDRPSSPGRRPAASSAASSSSHSAPQNGAAPQASQGYVPPHLRDQPGMVLPDGLHSFLHSSHQHGPSLFNQHSAGCKAGMMQLYCICNISRQYHECRSSWPQHPPAAAKVTPIKSRWHNTRHRHLSEGWARALRSGPARLARGVRGNGCIKQPTIFAHWHCSPSHLFTYFELSSSQTFIFNA